MGRVFCKSRSTVRVPIPILSSTATNFFVVPQDREGTVGKKRFIAISVLVRSNQNLSSGNTSEISQIYLDWNKCLYRIPSDVPGTEMIHYCRI